MQGKEQHSLNKLEEAMGMEDTKVVLMFRRA